jgi:ATP/maltotriose-dependent transcriptional regulator MalT
MVKVQSTQNPVKSSANRTKHDEWSRGRLLPPAFGFVCVSTRALTLLQTRALPRLTAVCAPPGYGKTVLLTRIVEHFRSRGDRCLWLTLDDRDRDVLSLLALLRGGAVQGIDPQSDERAADVGLFADPVELMDAVIDDIRRLPGRTLIFIDNLGLREDPRLAVLLERLVFDSGPELHLVISSNRALPAAGSAGGISPPAAHRTVRKPLDLHGSSQPFLRHLAMTNRRGR